MDVAKFSLAWGEEAPQMSVPLLVTRAFQHAM